MRICVSRHIFVHLTQLENHKSEGGGGHKYTFLEIPLQWDPKNFKIRAIGATREKLLRQKP